jgi:uncharacterized protein (TIGR02266 family)
MRPLRTGGQLQEQRKHARVHSRVRCWCEGDAVTFFSRVGNLSEGGLFLRTSTPLPYGAPARLRIQLGTALEIEVKARVIWSRGEGEVGPPGMGLAFEGAGGEELDELRRFISRELAGRHGKD